MTPPEDAADERIPSFSESLAAAARKSGFSRLAPGEPPTAHALLGALGGVRGLVESIVPGLGFLVVYTFTRQLLPSVLAPLALALVFVLVRVLRRSPALPAISGLIGIGLSALLALWSGRAQDNFVLGFWINGVWVTALLASIAVRWPLVGLIAGTLASEPTAWRSDKAKFRVATITSVLWAVLFGARLAVELPLYFAGQAQWLAATKLLMGVPLYAAMLWVTWLLVRAVYARAQPD